MTAPNRYTEDQRTEHAVRLSFITNVDSARSLGEIEVNLKTNTFYIVEEKKENRGISVNVMESHSFMASISNTKEKHLHAVYSAALSVPPHR